MTVTFRTDRGGIYLIVTFPDGHFVSVFHLRYPNQRPVWAVMRHRGLVVHGGGRWTQIPPVLTSEPNRALAHLLRHIPELREALWPTSSASS
jgi:hypothetical protein